MSAVIAVQCGQVSTESLPYSVCVYVYAYTHTLYDTIIVLQLEVPALSRSRH